ncbi:DUF6482 family protein [Pseudomonas sp.]|uniref:DUF6482 family protein n=1 Tax=Pseudomonas sp. TaxID=306 RepID=UPI00272A21FB|nr:DUF6482 family protein [Pseudomonas sp.]
MNLREMTRLATEGQVRELELLSIEGGFYLVRVQVENGFHTLLNEQGKPMHVRSATQLRDLIGYLPETAAFPCTLVQHVVHDEMCGVRSGPIEPLRVPFSLTPGW